MKGKGGMWNVEVVEDMREDTLRLFGVAKEERWRGEEEGRRVENCLVLSGGRVRKRMRRGRVGEGEGDRRAENMASSVLLFCAHHNAKTRTTTQRRQARAVLAHAANNR